MSAIGEEMRQKTMMALYNWKKLCDLCRDHGITPIVFDWPQAMSHT
jgi:hypothetical protein